MVMASSTGLNVPAGAGGDGVGNPTAAAAATEECRLRRRRRLETQGSGEAGPSWVRRLRPAAGSRFSPSSSSSSSAQEEEADPDVQEMELAPLPPPAAAGVGVGVVLQPQPEPEPEPEPEAPPVAAVVAAQRVWPLAFGSVTMAGRMRIMEDTVSLHPNLCYWPADGSPIHFFAVFDGHGGPHVRVCSPSRPNLCL